jgi:hypothetical protein
MTSVVNLSLFDLSHKHRELAVKALDVLRPPVKGAGPQI